MTWTHPARLAPVLALTLLAGTTTPPAQAQEPERNLHVLPSDISRRDLNRVMLANLAGLGLPRRQNEGCLFCHVGDMEQPASTWDWASDAKPMKLKARVMMEMTQDINASLDTLTHRVAPDLRVTCFTCHKGRTDPRPIEDILRTAHSEEGVAGMETRYLELREGYFGGDAYDFRVHVLPDLAAEIIAGGSYEEGMRLADFNEGFFPDDPSARRASISLELRHTAPRDLTAALEAYEAYRTDEPDGVVNWQVLDGLGWHLYQQDLRDEAMEVFERNLRLFPEEFVPNESLADLTRVMVGVEEAIVIYEDFLDRHPDHGNARWKLRDLELRRQR